MNDAPESELTSWKEIAQRLQVTVRTAQAWEKTRGLPVRRLPGGRGRVFACAQELEEWMGLQTPPQGTAPAARGAGTPRRRSGDRLLRSPVMRTVAFAGFVSVIALAVWSAPSPARQPAMWEVSGDSFVVRDEDARELWRVAFAEGLAEWVYSGPQSVPQFVDFEGDGSIETLFPQWSPNQAEVAGLICFTETGEERWRFVPGREVSTGTEPFENIFHIASFLPLDLPNGEKGVVAVSLHFPQYPTQVVVLSAETGRILAEYWHSGHVGTKADQLGVYDLDGDGVSEIYLVGISNSYRQATLVVLDPRTMEGASAEESAEYQLQGFARGQEVFRMLFPRSSMSKINDPYNSAINLWATPNQVVVSVLEDLTDATGPVILYHLRPDFSLEKITRTSSFDGVHERLLHEGLVETTLPKEEQALLRNVRVLTAPGVRDSSR